jgi:hypothetical protein
LYSICKKDITYKYSLYKLCDHSKKNIRRFFGIKNKKKESRGVSGKTNEEVNRKAKAELGEKQRRSWEKSKVGAGRKVRSELVEESKAELGEKLIAGRKIDSW